MRPPSEHKLAELERVVRDRVGFDPQSIGDRGLLQAVCRRMKDGRLPDGDTYVDRLLEDDLEFESFVETLLVPETWFFRDQQPFRHLQGYATGRRHPTALGDRIRVLSIPCSTGEEAYSIAMALLDTGMSPSQFHIDAADVSRGALSRAAKAVYGRGSFRGDEAAFPGLCDRFLKQRDQQFAVSAELRETVRFFHANLVAPSLLSDQPPYHVIFCRNVLIYLGAEARRKALANLRRILLPAGLLYVGHVEARVVTEDSFCRYGNEYPFVFTPATTNSANGPAAIHVELASPSHKARPASGQAAAAAAVQANDTLPVDPPRPIRGPDRPRAGALTVETEAADRSPAEKLASARLAADAGRLDEAIPLCQEILEQEPANTEALCLLGLVANARGQTAEAEALFQKVLYLDPRCEEALVHMSLLAEKRGDAKRAANFRRRAQQAQGRETRL